MSEKTITDLSGLLRSGSAVRGKAASSNKPSGKFAEIGGIEIRAPQSFETEAKPINFAAIGGVEVYSSRRAKQT
jgi:hypothetical protein